jgi:hypothetical protein
MAAGKKSSIDRALRAVKSLERVSKLRSYPLTTEGCRTRPKNVLVEDG